MSAKKNIKKILSKLPILKTIYYNQQEIRGLQDAKQYIADTLAHHDFQISELDNGKKFLADAAAHQSFLINQLEVKCMEQENAIFKLRMRMEYLCNGDENAAAKVIQIVPVVRYGDAVGNCVLAIGNSIRRLGYSCETYTDYIDSKIQDDHVKEMTELPALNKKDVAIIHVAAENRILDLLDAFVCKVVICYHNITPPSFFAGYNKLAYDSSKNGLKQLERASGQVRHCVADSDFNRQDLIKLGFQGDISVIPLILDFTEYERDPNHEVLNLQNKEVNTLLSVGRIAPNKKIEDVISVFWDYKQKYDQNARLILAGRYNEEDPYYRQLLELIERDQICDVYFTGHITTEELNAYFKISDLYLCMSEHEGFCVPLVEAMYFDLPVVAYNSTAIPDTLGGAGVLVENKDSKTVGEVIHRIMTDTEYRKKLIECQRRRLLDFQPKVVENQFCQYIRTILEEENVSD